jgi:hypothetical protein
VTEIDPSQRDDPVESGALEDEPDVPGETRPPSSDEPAEGGALDDDAS